MSAHKAGEWLDKLKAELGKNPKVIMSGMNPAVPGEGGSAGPIG